MTLKDPFDPYSCKHDQNQPFPMHSVLQMDNYAISKQSKSYLTLMLKFTE